MLATPQQRRLSQAGKDLFQLVPSNDLKKQPRSQNSFSELQDSSEDEHVTSAPPSPRSATSPRTRVPVSPRFLWGRYDDPGTGSPWQAASVASRVARIPMLSLDAADPTMANKPAVAAVTAPNDDDDEDDSLFYAAVDVKARRAYGNGTKPNTYKAASQRSFQMGKRDEQRLRNRAAAAAAAAAPDDSGVDAYAQQQLDFGGHSADDHR